MIEGGALDFEDPYVLGAHIDAQTENLLQVILPILLAVAILILIINMALTGGLTKESLITLMIVAVIGVIIIQVLLEL